jgi:hypothetical protein
MQQVLTGLRTETPCLSGTLISAQRPVLAEKLGRDRFERALASISPRMREEYVSASPLSWVPIATVEAVYVAMAREAGVDVPSLHREVARKGIEHTLKSMWRLLLRLTSDESLISRTPVIYARGYSRGRLEVTIPRPGRGEIKLMDWPDAPDFTLRGVGVGVETVLVLAGRKDVRVTCERRPHGALLIASWRV